MATSLQTYLQEYKYLMYFNPNGNLHGFKHQLLLSNKAPEKKISTGKHHLLFINYDHKNNIERFKEKSNNPLQFPEQLFIEAEKIIEVTESLVQDTLFPAQEITIHATVTKEEYIQKVNTLKQHIQQGDIYEINFCITFEASHVTVDPLLLYQKLNAISRASYSAFVKLDHLYIISSSPELFLEKTQHKLISKPIKGTAKRGVTESEDNALKNALYENKKERNENVMIVDVTRNDLSRIAQKGSVTVEKLFDIETYQQVHQMVSTVSCEVKKTNSFTDIINATFPMASMTGAPKYKAMELSDAYELYNRGPYSGALGYLEPNGDFALNVLIRSIFYDEKKRYISFTVGSAITALCNAEDEYEECLLKAKALISVLK